MKIFKTLPAVLLAMMISCAPVTPTYAVTLEELGGSLIDQGVTIEVGINDFSTCTVEAGFPVYTCVALTLDGVEHNLLIHPETEQIINVFVKVTEDQYKAIAVDELLNPVSI